MPFTFSSIIQDWLKSDETYHLKVMKLIFKRTKTGELQQQKSTRFQILNLDYPFDVGQCGIETSAVFSKYLSPLQLRWFRAPIDRSHRRPREIADCGSEGVRPDNFFRHLQIQGIVWHGVALRVFVSQATLFFETQVNSLQPYSKEFPSDVPWCQAHSRTGV